MSENGQQAPLIERLRSVPAAARVLEHTPNPLGYDTTSIPVGALCWEAADRIAELEAELERERVRVAACGVVAMANTRDSAREARQVLPEYRSALLCDVERAVDREMAERERREAAEALLLELVAVVRGECPSLLDEDSGGDARTSLDIDAHFARYKKEPT